jgi:NAD+ synthase (glutamine-hydrolysing)
MTILRVATCSLNQWALDWEGNLLRIKQSIQKAKSAGCRFRTGPELEICGYGLLDHFLEMDTYTTALEMLLRLLSDTSCYEILIDVGLPIMHRGLRYNCRALVLNSKLLFLRPKLWLANDGNYREMRFFTAWDRPQHVEDWYITNPSIAKLQGSRTVPIGMATTEITAAYEM